MATAVRSYSKVNLGLAIGATRADGFHSLATVYQTLALHDVVIVSAERAAETAIALSSNHPRVPLDGRNTAWRMVEGCLKRLGVEARVSVHIEKNLRVQGGMGAGSANAAAALIGLERELEDFTAGGGAAGSWRGRLGPDVPLFFDRGSGVLGDGARGDCVSDTGYAGLGLCGSGTRGGGFYAAGFSSVGCIAEPRGQGSGNREQDSGQGFGRWSAWVDRSEEVQ